MTKDFHSPVLAFFSGRGTDGRGRSIEDVWRFSDEEIERHHDFIQWLFPLPTRSGAVPNAPVLSQAEIERVRADPSLQHPVRRSLDRMSAFYADNGHWLVLHDHNHLRISRILRSVGLLLGHRDALAFHEQIVRRVADAGNPVSETSLAFWREALAASEGR